MSITYQYELCDLLMFSVSFERQRPKFEQIHDEYQRPHDHSTTYSTTRFQLSTQNDAR